MLCGKPDVSLETPALADPLGLSHRGTLEVRLKVPRATNLYRRKLPIFDCTDFGGLGSTLDTRRNTEWHMGSSSLLNASPEVRVPLIHISRKLAPEVSRDVK